MLMLQEEDAFSPNGRVKDVARFAGSSTLPKE